MRFVLATLIFVIVRQGGRFIGAMEFNRYAVIGERGRVPILALLFLATNYVFPGNFAFSLKLINVFADNVGGGLYLSFVSPLGVSKGWLSGVYFFSRYPFKSSPTDLL